MGFEAEVVAPSDCPGGGLEYLVCEERVEAPPSRSAEQCGEDFNHRNDVYTSALERGLRQFAHPLERRHADTSGAAHCRRDRIQVGPAHHREQSVQAEGVMREEHIIEEDKDV